MKLYLVNVIDNSTIKFYEENLNDTGLVKSQDEGSHERILGAFSNRAVADFIVEKYCKPTSKCEILNSNEAGTSWKERETQKKFYVKEFDTEKEHASVYNIPNSYNVVFMGDKNVSIDQVRFIPGKDFDQIVAEFENSKQPEK